MPFGKAEALVIDSGKHDTVSENAWLVDAPSVSATLMVGVNVPITVGVPEIFPFELSATPVGREPLVIDQK